MAVNQNICPIEQMPHLAARLGKARVAQIRYLDLPMSVKPSTAKALENTVINLVQGYKVNTLPSAYQDVLIGACRTVSMGKQPLDPDCLLAILQSIETLYVREIENFLDCSERNARRYMQACKLSLPFITRMI